MILGHEAILSRLERGEIFRGGTWDAACIREASYNLRIAPDGMLLGKKQYPPGKVYPKDVIKIEPGEIAVLSTVERFNMPSDVVGHQGIKFDYAVQGLTGLMGIQVDPLYGSKTTDERFYLRFTNNGDQPVSVRPGDKIFNIEFETVTGSPNREEIDKREGLRQPTWERLCRLMDKQDEPSWNYARSVREMLYKEVDVVKRGYEPVVMFGVFLVAVSILGVVLTALLTADKASAGPTVPIWVSDWGWKLLVVALAAGTIATAAMGIATVFRFIFKR